ncbi:hypothetical protein [Methylocella tundrae]|uniref:hypothetical protein n=1 Tax=Methylocella tundrae TaxID=227605 RepID=UPI00106B932D
MAVSAALLTTSATGAGTTRPIKPIWRPISDVSRIARLERFSSSMARRNDASSVGDSGTASVGMRSRLVGAG